MLKTAPDAERITAAVEQSNRTLAQNQEMAAEVKKYVKPARWLRSLLLYGPGTLSKHLEQIVGWY